MAELTREELLILLHKKDNQESKTLKCIYKPVRGVHKECLEKVSTPYGFCKKHSRTVQARKAHQEWETHEAKTAPVVATQEVVTPVETPVETPVATAPEVVTPVETSIEEVVGEIEETLLPSREVHKAPRRKAAPKTIRRKAAPKPVRRKAPKPVRRKAPKKTRKKYITPNIWGRYEDTDTHICFDAETHSAYGVQAKNGELIALGPREIAICEKNRWKYETVEEDSSESDYSEEDLNSYESEGDSYSEEASEEESEEASEGESEGESEKASEGESEASSEESESEGDSGGDYLSRSESSESESDGEYYY